MAKIIVFLFIEEYDNKEGFDKPLSMNGAKTIYSPSQNECSPFGKYLEYSLMKSGILKTKI